MAPRTPLVRPFRYFASVPPGNASPALVLGLVAACAVAIAVGVYGLGQVLAAEVSGTVTVDNPAYPGDAFCEGSMPDDFGPSGCDEPATVERDASTLVREAFSEATAYLVGLFLVGWLIGTAVLHVAAWFAGGEGTLLDTAEVSAWSGVAVTGSSLLSLSLAGVVIRTQGLDGSDAQAIADSILAIAEELGPLFALLSVLGVTWQAVVWFAGLTERHGVDGGRAGLVAGLLWFLSVLGAL